jgi:hypothetical protein
VDFLVIYVEIEGVIFLLDVFVYLSVDNHDLQSWHWRFLECCGRTSRALGKTGVSGVKRDNAFD